jgi:3-hydroxymyristoyl/3-hydroxydecanoyl-(acyl carrier protein) dehydratase
MKVVEKFGPGEIRERIPHRGRNFVVDRIEFFEDDEGVLRARSFLRVQPGDAEGRDLFLQGPAGRLAYSEFVLVEHMALTSAVYIAPFMGDGKIAFFSTITNFEGGRLLPAGTEVEALIESAGRKGPFHRSLCTIRAGAPGDGEIRTDLMAAVVDPRGGERMEGEKKVVPPPERREPRPVDRSLYRFKDPRMVFVDEEMALDRAASTLTARYVYPQDHPFTAGHFPGNPVMMGVSQWAGVLDAAFWLTHRLGTPPGTRLADGEILRADGSLVTEVKGLEFLVGGEGAVPRLLRTKRIGFRDMVRAGEEIFYRVRLRA